MSLHLEKPKMSLTCHYISFGYIDIHILNEEAKKRKSETKCHLHLLLICINKTHQITCNIRQKNQELVPLLNSGRIMIAPPFVSPLFIVGACYNPSDVVAVFHLDPILL